MKKLAMLIILPIITLSIATSHAKKNKIHKAKDWAKEKISQYIPEDKTIAKGIKYTGEAIGTATGAASGFFLGKKIARDLKTINLETKESIVNAPLMGVSSGISIFLAGKEIGQYLGEKAAVFYLSKKGNVSSRIALASLIADLPLTDETKQLFQEAKQQSNPFLRGFLTSYYSNVLGNNWYTIISKALDNPLAPEIGLVSYMSPKQIIQFIQSTYTPYVIAMLYFNEKFPSSITRSYRARIKMTKKLFDELFTEKKETTFNPSE